MPQNSQESNSRRPRADSLRNRELILTVARDAFAGRGAAVTLEDVVRLTGLGVGTLYRHFPSRDALIEAVYLSEVERLAAAERTLSATETPVDALRAWMLLFADFVATKSALKEILNALVEGTDKLYAQSTGLLIAAINALVERAVENGEIRIDIPPVDLLRALAGVVNSEGETDWTARAEKMVDLLIAGLRVK